MKVASQNNPTPNFPPNFRTPPGEGDDWWTVGEQKFDTTDELVAGFNPQQPTDAVYSYQAPEPESTDWKQHAWSAGKVAVDAATVGVQLGGMLVVGAFIGDFLGAFGALVNPYSRGLGPSLTEGALKIAAYMTGGFALAGAAYGAVAPSMAEPLVEIQGTLESKYNEQGQRDLVFNVNGDRNQAHEL